MTTAPAAMLANLSGRRAFEDLPHSCRCGNRWAGANTTHCGACHTFIGTGVGAFDAHRKGGVCNPPADAGLVLIPGRAYEVWGTRGGTDD